MIYEVFRGKDLRTCKRIMSKMLEFGHTIESFFEFVDTIIAEESMRRRMGMSSIPLIELQVDKEKLKTSDVLAAIGWRPLKSWLKICSLLAQHDLTIIEIKKFVNVARKVELKNTAFGKVKG